MCGFASGVRKPMSANAFPQTRRTWIDDALDRGGDGVHDVNGHIMETYAWPLRVYYLGTNSRWLGEPDDVIDGFFADRLARDSFLGDWRASGLRLRRWLINAFCFYLLELRRRKLGAGIILEQQVSLASAAAAYARLKAGVGRITPRRVLACTPAQLMRMGQTRQKTRYCRALASAFSSLSCVWTRSR